MNTLRLALCLVAIAALAIWQVAVIPASPMYAVVGATLVPALVVGLYSICAVLYSASVLRNIAVDVASDPDEGALPEAPRRLAAFVLGALAFVLTIKWLGFIVSATVAGVGIARAFDAPIRAKSVVICAAIAVTFWTLFDLMLGVDLGPILPLLAKTV